ncbi:unnamed protein product [Ectocarpus fasciculatus]
MPITSEKAMVVGAAVGWILIVYQAYQFVKKKKRGANPFSKDTRKKIEPFVSDKKKRDDVLKNGFTVKKFEGAGKEYDAIIIGSGIGGLMAAALMSRAGKRVLVLEQHDQAGGCCHSFNEKGFEFDTGIHYIGEMRNNTSVRFLFDQVSNGQLQWADVADDFDTVIVEHRALPQQRIPFMSDQEATMKSIISAFPGEEVAIRKYFETLAQFRKSMLGFVSLKAMPVWMGKLLIYSGLMSKYTDFFEYASTSASDFIRSITSNDRLRAVLSYNFGDYGTIPGDAAFSMHAALQAHFLKGVSYPVGGSSEIAFHIIPSITAAGGDVFVRAPVAGIVLDQSGTKASGVRMQKDGYVIRAPIVISDAGLFNTAVLLPEIARPHLENMTQHVRPGTGGMSVYVGLKGTAKELGIEGKHYWAMWTKKGAEDLDEITTTYLERDRKDILNGDMNLPLLFISFPSAKDPLWDEHHPGKSTATIVTFANYSWFEEWENARVMHRGKEYNELKNALGKLVWDQTLALFPHLHDKVEYFDVGTPVTNRYYIGAAAGEMYGCDHDMKRFTPHAAVDLRPETSIKNLYITGQDAFNCGFVGASFGGLFCASTVLDRNLYEDLNVLKKKSPPSIPRK